MKRTGIAAAACALLLTGCGQGETVKNIRIGVTVYDQHDTFISELMENFMTFAAKKEEETGVAITVETVDAAGSQSAQNEQVTSLIEKGCNVICVNLVDRTEPATITDMAEKNETPVIFFNRELVPEDLERWEQLYYVGADASESGNMQGELAAEAFLSDAANDKNGDNVCQYVVLEGEAGHQDAIVRTERSVNAMAEQGVALEKLGYAIANWDRAQAKTQVTAMLDEYGDRMELILANNDDMALGAIDALKALTIPEEDWPVIVGIDGTDVGLAAVLAGEMAATVYNDKEAQAENMLDLAYVLATGGDLAQVPFTEGRYIREPYYKITAENALEYLQ